LIRGMTYEGGVKDVESFIICETSDITRRVPDSTPRDFNMDTTSMKFGPTN
jgi:hypothetical protein